MGQLRVSCFCGAISQTPSTHGGNDNIPICHCYGCRHSTGQLYASYLKVDPSTVDVSASNLKGYTSVDGSDGSTPTVKLHFCDTCGCHIYRSVTTQSATSVEVASGAIAHDDETSAQFGPHINLSEAKDGGIGQWLATIEAQHNDNIVHYDTNTETTVDKQPSSTVPAPLTASCLCGRVTFRITPPTASSLAPRSNFADLIIPYHTQDALIQNPHDTKWWMRRNNTRYLAGLCSCRSCRLFSGFEVQSWAFVPKVNIEFPVDWDWTESNHGDVTDLVEKWEPLDFDNLNKQGILSTYESSTNVMREFCGGCGATVFWHDTARPDLIDVSVGLLRAREGARAEQLLEWWTGRVSFAEDAVLGRDGAASRRAEGLVRSLERNMMMQNGG